ncbi:translation initiation factor IF-2-like [Hyaena hyaena]|uniref:translation initiation factor IF-2-like n=1 Tax=Hyaena hyaena TaxID=95912 RepID=UPI0019233921|nr:translation initiation factor IF-2-like [Hyaena hyaena]
MRSTRSTAELHPRARAAAGKTRIRRPAQRCGRLTSVPAAPPAPAGRTRGPRGPCQNVPPAKGFRNLRPTCLAAGPRHPSGQTEVEIPPTSSSPEAAADAREPYFVKTLRLKKPTIPRFPLSLIRVPASALGGSLEAGAEEAVPSGGMRGAGVRGASGPHSPRSPVPPTRGAPGGGARAGSPRARSFPNNTVGGYQVPASPLPKSGLPDLPDVQFGELLSSTSFWAHPLDQDTRWPRAESAARAPEGPAVAAPPALALGSRPRLGPAPRAPLPAPRAPGLGPHASASAPGLRAARTRFRESPLRSPSPPRRDRVPPLPRRRPPQLFLASFRVSPAGFGKFMFQGGGVGAQQGPEDPGTRPRASPLG